MKRYGIIAAIAAAALLLGCSRSEMPGKDSSSAVSSRPMKACASFADGTKSHFGIDGYRLVWDATDKIYAYSSCMGTWAGFETKTLEMLAAMGIAPEDATPKDMEDASIYAYFRLLERSRQEGWNRSDVFNIDPTGSGKVSAMFESVGPASGLFGEPENPTGEELYLFYAFYPAPATLPAVSSYYFLDQPNQLVRETPFPYVYVEVPAVQDGIHYQDYQLLMNGDAPASMEEAVMRTDDQLSFNNFFPLTSILEFTLGTTDNIQASIARLEVSVETQEEVGGPYRGGKYMLGGKVPCFFSWDESGELRLWNRYCAPILSGFSKNYALETIPDPLDWDYDAARWDGAADASPVVTIQFASPVEISQTQTTQKYYAVVIPSRCVNNAYGNPPHIVFNAYNSAGDKILTKTITASSPRGIDEGKKYSFDLTLDTYYDENVLSGLFSVDEGKQIYIARGNLQALWNGSNVEQWKIAQHQYDFVGASSFDLSSDTGWFDLFSFSVEGNNYGITNATDPLFYGDFSEHRAIGWTGAYPVAQGNGWRTITADEGVYLFAERENAADLFSFGTIYAGSPEQAIYGLIFLPDAWDRTNPPCLFSSAEDKGFSWVSPTGNFQFDYSWNTYNADGGTSGTSGNWDDMQAAGAVFWPVAGRREGTTVNLSIGAYWSGTPNDEPDDDDDPGLACMLQFEAGTNGYFSPDHFPAYYGACVRLIKDLN